MKKKNKKVEPIIFIDMDEVLCDFSKAADTDQKSPPEMYGIGFFQNLEPIPGSLEAVRRLLDHGFRIEILTQPVAESAISYTEKARWILMWLPELKDHITLTQDKLMLGGDDRVLIDDNPGKWGGFKGEFIHLRGINPRKEWEEIVDWLVLNYEV